MPPPFLKKDSSARDALGFGLNFAVGMALFSYLGFYVGRRAGHPALGAILGVTIGLGYGAYELWKMARHMEQNDKKPGPGHE